MSIFCRQSTLDIRLAEVALSGKPGAFDRSMQHHLM